MVSIQRRRTEPSDYKEQETTVPRPIRLPFIFSCMSAIFQSLQFYWKWDNAIKLEITVPANRTKIQSGIHIKFKYPIPLSRGISWHFIAAPKLFCEYQYNVQYCMAHLTIMIVLRSNKNRSRMNLVHMPRVPYSLISFTSKVIILFM